MGIHKQNQVRDYWSTDHRVPNHPMVYKGMGLNRFEQLQRYIHLSDPEIDGPAHTKVEPLNSYILKQSTVYWNPGTDVAVDEAMTRFTGRSSDIVTIPCKPIATGFKIWVLAQLGYSLSWMFHQKQKGPVGIKKAPKGLNKTNAVVLHLLNRLPQQPYCVWLDNLFTSHNLMTLLREKGYGAAGTGRINSGVVQDLIDKKNAEKTKDVFPWGSTSSDNKVCQLAWKDNGLGLFQSTIHTGNEPPIERLRKRPPTSFQKSKTARAPFGNNARAVLPVLAAADNYNYNMNHVDRADHLKAQNCGARPIRKGWKAIFLWLLNTTLINAYLLSQYSEHPEKFTAQDSFRIALYTALFDRSERLARKRKAPERIDSIKAPVSSVEPHVIKSLGRMRQCVVCKGRRGLVLGELDPNAQKAGPKRTSFGCNLCQVSLCKDGTCFEDFHDRNL